jgi:exopolysaccharide biosynthesis polyprenyl glycosylphosphotransferase
MATHAIHSSVAPLALPTSARLPLCRGVKREVLFSVVMLLLDTVTFSCVYLGFLHLRMLDPGANGLSSTAPLMLCLASIFVVFAASNRYSLRLDLNEVRFAAEHGLACLTAFSLALLLQFAVFIFDFSRSRLALIAAFIVFTPLTLLFRRVLGSAFRVRAETQTFFVIGAGAEAVRFYRACREGGIAQVLRFIDLGGARAGERLDGPDSPLVDEGREENFPAMLDGSIEAVVIAEPFPSLPLRSVEALVWTHFYHAPILTLETFYEKYWRKIPIVLDPLWALRQDFRLARDSSYRIFKRGMDLAVAGLGLLVALPLLAACALAVWVEAEGPVLYCQQRIRRDRQTFTLYKFRTMRATRGEPADDLYTRDDDGRVTKVGRWLRKLRLDELPQLWNVCKGDMSLIGPRPEWDRCVEIYEREIPCYHLRHLVKPGITGWAQVNYPYGRSVEDTVEKLKYDLYYIKNYSLLLDASIVLKTLYVILSFKGK